MPVSDFFYSGHKRVEIPKGVLQQVWKRVYDRTKSERFPDGNLQFVQCEGCGRVLGLKKAQYDHSNAEAWQMMHPNERPPITAGDVKYLGQDCCHKPKSAKEVKVLAKTKRLSAKTAQAKEKKKSKWLCGRNSNLKRKIGGEIVER